MDTVVQAIGFVLALGGGLIVLYIGARLVAVAWHNTKADYEVLLRKREGDHHGNKEGYPQDKQESER